MGPYRRRLPVLDLLEERTLLSGFTQPASVYVPWGPAPRGAEYASPVEGPNNAEFRSPANSFYRSDGPTYVTPIAPEGDASGNNHVEHVATVIHPVATEVSPSGGPTVGYVSTMLHFRGPYRQGPESPSSGGSSGTMVPPESNTVTSTPGEGGVTVIYAEPPTESSVGMPTESVSILIVHPPVEHYATAGANGGSKSAGEWLHTPPLFSPFVYDESYAPTNVTSAAYVAPNGPNLPTIEISASGPAIRAALTKVAYQNQGGHESDPTIESQPDSPTIPMREGREVAVVIGGMTTGVGGAVAAVLALHDPSFANELLNQDFDRSHTRAAGPLRVSSAGDDFLKYSEDVKSASPATASQAVTVLRPALRSEEPEQAESEPERPVPQGLGLIADLLPFDGSAVAKAVDRFFERFEDTDADSAANEEQATLNPPPLILMLAVSGLEWARRRLRRRREETLHARPRRRDGGLEFEESFGSSGPWSSRLS